MAPKRKIVSSKTEANKKAKTVTFQEPDVLEDDPAKEGAAEDNNTEDTAKHSELKQVQAPKQFQPIFTRKSVVEYDHLREGSVEVWLIQHPVDFDIKQVCNQNIEVNFSNQFGHAAVIDEKQQLHLYNDLPKSYKHLRALLPVKGSFASCPIHRRLSVLQGVDPEWHLNQARNALDQGSEEEEGEEEEDEDELQEGEEEHIDDSDANDSIVQLGEENLAPQDTDVKVKEEVVSQKDKVESIAEVEVKEEEESDAKNGKSKSHDKKKKKKEKKEKKDKKH